MCTIGAPAPVFKWVARPPFVLLLMAPSAVNKVLKSKAKVGTDLTAAAGPSGATSTGSVGGADILTYGRTKVLFSAYH